ncbi:C-C motif chemokine 26 isoform X2 [Mesocricetus auratus]|uniref:C-C motif chemokine 26 isoform X2 n=1 Tax=Mesocricetus auratus TaxID=10036 RepID=A0ABM2W9I2_MESAU|nr:C-C motif chemokine 26 isoform X2 [Mesocricetus auratus]
MADQTLGNIPDGGFWDIHTNAARSQPATWRVLHGLIEDKTRGIQKTSMKSPGQWTMKTFFSVSPVVLLAFLLSVRPGAATRGDDITKLCCVTHSVIPYNWVNSYELAKSRCSHEVVIFTTKGGRKFCVQPQVKWVQRYISMLKARKNAGVVAQGPLN